MRYLFLALFLSTTLWASSIEEYGVNSGNFVVFVPTVTPLSNSDNITINIVTSYRRDILE